MAWRLKTKKLLECLSKDDEKVHVQTASTLMSSSFESVIEIVELQGKCLVDRESQTIDSFKTDPQEPQQVEHIPKIIENKADTSIRDSIRKLKSEIENLEKLTELKVE